MASLTVNALAFLKQRYFGTEEPERVMRHWMANVAQAWIDTDHPHGQLHINCNVDTDTLYVIDDPGFVVDDIEKWFVKASAEALVKAYTDPDFEQRPLRPQALR
jgi:hypothetical protein